MRIGLIDVDGHNFPNLALMRISAYWKSKGATVEWGKFVWGRNYFDQPIIIGAACSICHKVSEFQTRYRPCCGADMRKEEDDER